jgi:hypothetical protein
MTSRNPTPATLGALAAHCGHKPVPPAPHLAASAEAYALASREYMRAYEEAISSLKVGML